jgi:GR25 family glycosyltransferase involved in LPS biosynthesis
MVNSTNINSYVINLRHRTDRKNHIINELKKVPMVNYTIIDAIQDETKTCFASHLKCIKLAKDNKLPFVLILEDDCLFTSECNETLNIILKEIQTLKWDMFFLGANLQSPSTQITSNLLKLSGAYTSHSYMVHERFYDTILNLPHICEIDAHYSNLMSTHNVYMCDPMIAYQLPSYSDLQNGVRDYNDAMYNNYLRFKP